MNELEMDALTELVNIGVGHAANNLRQLVDEQVLLTLPTLEILSRVEAAAMFSNQAGNSPVAVRQAFQGEFAGSALLVFPESNSLELVRAVTRTDLSLEDIIELEQEALAEVGNIILNGCMGTIANLLQRSLKMSLPEIIRGTDRNFFESGAAASTASVLLIRITFSLTRYEVSGCLAIVMDCLAMDVLRVLIADFIGRSTGLT